VSLVVLADQQALTIAVRYAAVRRQFSSGKNKVSKDPIRSEPMLISQLETQIIDYPIHQRRLMVSSCSLMREYSIDASASRRSGSSYGLHRHETHQYVQRYVGSSRYDGAI
jgi:hypothetical protein